MGARRRFSGLRARVTPDERRLICLVLFWHRPRPTGRCADRTRTPGLTGWPHPTSGGPRGGAILGGWVVDSPMWSRIFFTVAASLMKAMIRGVADRATQWQGFIDARQQHSAAMRAGFCPAPSCCACKAAHRYRAIARWRGSWVAAEVGAGETPAGASAVTTVSSGALGASTP